MAETNTNDGNLIIRTFISLISFIVRTSIRFGITIGLIASVVITLYAVGQLSKDAIKERKQGKHI